ncbi:MAG: HEAT repeat domain-containing protein [Thermoflexales bacterium]
MSASLDSPSNAPLAAALAALRDEALPSEQLMLCFSDLEGERLEQWGATWESLPDERRAALIEQMVDIAEDNLQANFDAIFRYALRDPLERVRLSAIEGLSHESHLSALDILLDLLQHDPSLTVRAAAAESLGRFVLAAEMQQLAAEKGELVCRALLRVLRQAPTNSLLYRRALESLAHFSHPEVDYHIRAAYYANDDLLLVSALTAMGRSCNAEYRSLVRAELHNVSPMVRRSAAIAAGELEDEAALPDLLKLLEDPSIEVQQASITALVSINQPEAREAIARAARSDDPAISQHAESALQAWDFWHREAEFPLLDVMDETQQSFRVRRIPLRPESPADR